MKGAQDSTSASHTEGEALSEDDEGRQRRPRATSRVEPHFTADVITDLRFRQSRADVG